MLDHTQDRAAMAALLERLLVGADQMMDTVGCWSDRLIGGGGTLLAARFVHQLEKEWLPAPAPDAFCEEVAGQVRAHLGATHAGWPHLWAHILRVTGIALALGAEEGLDPPLAYLLGMCHDVAKLDEEQTGKPHEQMGAAFAGRVLDGHLPPAAIDSIQAAILKEGDDLLGRILHDADKLDKIGATGLLRRISTDTRRDWLPQALARVAEDKQTFPAMNFPRSDAMAASKKEFLAWFLPLAEAATAG